MFNGIRVVVLAALALDLGLSGTLEWDGGGRRASHCSRVVGGALVIDGSDRTDEEWSAALGRRYMRADGEAMPLVTRVIRIVATESEGGISDSGEERSVLNLLLGRWQTGTSMFDVFSFDFSVSWLVSVEATLAIKGGTLITLSKSAAHPRPTSPFLPAPRSRESHSTLLPFGRLSQLAFFFNLSSSSH